MIINQKHSAKIGYFLILLLFVTSCHNSKKGTEQSVFHQRKPYKEVFHQANSEKMIGHDEKAIELFEQCLVIEPSNPAAHYALSELYEKQGDDEKSYTHAEQAYTLSPTNKWYILRLADLSYDRENFSKTADLYAKIIGEEKNLDVKFKYTDILIKANRLEAAIKMMDEIEVETGKLPELTFTKHDLYKALEKSELAQRELDNFMTESDNPDEAKMMVAEFYIDQMKPAEAQVLIESVLKANPNYPQAYILLADLELRQNHLTTAFSHLKKAFVSPDIELDQKLDIIRGLIPYTEKNQPDHLEMKNGLQSLFDVVYDPALNNSVLHGYYGLFLQTQGELEKSESQFQRSCDLDPSSFNNWLQLLSIQKQAENYQGLFDNAKKAAELFPSQPILYLFAGIGAKEIKDYSASEEWYFIGKELVVKDPQLTSEFLYQIGDLNYQQGNTEESQFYFEQALAINPGNINVYADRATHLMAANRISEAEIEIKNGLAEVPKSSKLLTVYGDILFEKKDYSTAATIYLQALYDNYTNGKLLERCGDAHFLMGEPSKALELWNEALKNGNTSALLKRKIETKKYYPSE